MTNEMRESPDVRAGLVAALLGAFVLFVVVSGAVLFAFYQAYVRNGGFVPPNRFAEPTLQTGFDGLREPQIAAQRAALERFHWIDREHRVFAIPIERAMRLVAARGAKAYDPVPAPGGAAKP